MATLRRGLYSTLCDSNRLWACSCRPPHPSCRVTWGSTEEAESNRTARLHFWISEKSSPILNLSRVPQIGTWKETELLTCTGTQSRLLVGHFLPSLLQPASFFPSLHKQGSVFQTAIWWGGPKVLLSLTSRNLPQEDNVLSCFKSVGVVFGMLSVIKTSDPTKEIE